MTRAHRAPLALVVFGLVGLVGLEPLHAATAPGQRQAIVFLVDGASFEDLLGVTAFRGLAASGGAGLLSSRTPVRDALAALHPDPTEVEIHDLGTVAGTDGRADPIRLVADADLAINAISASPADQVLVVVATPRPPPASLAAKDELPAVVVATGAPAELVSEMGSAAATNDDLGSLTSDSTRRQGVVVSTDIPATVAAFVGTPAPAAGSVIRVDTGAAAPFDLHARYLDYRRMSVPVQTLAGIYVAVAGLLGVASLRYRRSLRRRTLRSAGWLGFSFLPFVTALLVVGHLPTLSYWTVVPAIVALTAAGTVAGTFVAADRGPLVALAAAGAAVLVIFLIEGVLGWTAALTPFLGGSELDGGRFFGLPNVEIGLLLGASLFVASRLPRAETGAALIAGVGLFAGFPWSVTGSNLGASVTLFAAAGLWYGIRREGHLGLRELGYALLVSGAGALVVVLAHRYLTSAPTHITRFVEGGEGGMLHTIRERLDTGFGLIARNPFALIPVIGVPVCMYVVQEPPAPVLRSFVHHPEWRHAIVVLLVASVVAYVVNDSGAAALGLGFGSAVGGLLFVSLFEEPGKMEA